MEVALVNEFEQIALTMSRSDFRLAADGLSPAGAVLGASEATGRMAGGDRL